MMILPERGLATIMLVNANDFVASDAMLPSVDQGVVAHLTGRGRGRPRPGRLPVPG